MSERSDLVDLAWSVAVDLLENAEGHAERTEAVKAVAAMESARVLSHLAQQVSNIDDALRSIARVWGSDR